jgi:hypothetical protein
MLARVRCPQSTLERHAPDSLQALFQELIRSFLDERGAFSVRRSAVGRIIFKTAILGRIVRRSYDDAIRPSCRFGFVVVQNGVRDSRSWRVLPPTRDHDGNIVRGQHFQRAGKGRLGQRVRVDPQKERALDAILFAIKTDCLGDCQNVPLIEGPSQG